MRSVGRGLVNLAALGAVLTATWHAAAQVPPPANGAPASAVASAPASRPVPAASRPVPRPGLPATAPATSQPASAPVGVLSPADILPVAVSEKHLPIAQATTRAALDVPMDPDKMRKRWSEWFAMKPAERERLLRTYQAMISEPVPRLFEMMQKQNEFDALPTDVKKARVQLTKDVHSFVEQLTPVQRAALLRMTPRDRAREILRLMGELKTNQLKAKLEQLGDPATTQPGGKTAKPATRP